MELDPARVAEVRAWLRRAREDLLAAGTLLGAEEPLPEVAVFHCQQAAEKALKGYLTWYDRPFRKTRNLEELGEQCLGIDPGLRDLIDRAVPLTDYTWRFRYPGDAALSSPAEARDACAVAEEVYEAIAGRLPREARP